MKKMSEAEINESLERLGKLGLISNDEQNTSEENSSRDCEQDWRNYYEKMLDQIDLLIEWNLSNIDKEPEQVRKNIETIRDILSKTI